MVQKVVQDLVVGIQKVAPGYRVDADTARVVQDPTLSFKHPWPNDREYMDNPEGEVLFVTSMSSTVVYCLMEDFYVRDEVAYPLKDLDALISASLPVSNPTRHSMGGDMHTRGVATPSGVSIVDIDDNGHPIM